MIASAIALTLLTLVGLADTPPLPITVDAEVDTAETSITGVMDVKLWCTPHEAIDRALMLRVVVSDGTRTLFERDRAFTPSTKRWRAGKPVELEFATPFPIVPGLEPGIDLDFRVGFFDPATNEVIPPEGYAYRPGVVLACVFEAPRFDPVVSDDRIDALIDRARSFASSGNAGSAWDVLELGIRLAPDDAVKERLREHLEKLGDHAPRPISAVEKAIVERRVSEEKARYFRLIAGRMFDRKQFHGALKLMEMVGGELAEQADEAVIGAVNEAERLQRDVDDVKQKLLEWMPDDDRAAVDKLLAAGLDDAALRKAEDYLSQGRFGAARRLFKELRMADDERVKDRAYELIPIAEERYLAAMPPEQEEEVRATIEHPSWARTTSVASHRFVFIGPKALVETIPESSRLRFDLAYVFITDLFGRVPNPAGDRVTVYFKELWDFGGGVGGGKIIDIGRAKPDARGTRVDNGLLYHELTHCVDDTKPIFAGFREGLANVGAVYAYEALGQKSDGLHGFKTNLDAFRDDYLARDLEYWRIQNYGPSAGLFLHFIDAYARRRGSHDWSPLRRFFREYRDAPIRDGREPFIARAFTHYLMRAFGDHKDAVFDDLVRFRFPLQEEDRDILGREIDAFAGGGMFDFEDDGAFQEFPNSPLPRDRAGMEHIQVAKEKGADAARAFGEQRLGVIYDWKVIGPFSRKGTDPDVAVFPPEYEIDFDKRYTVHNEIANWRDPTTYRPVILEPTGWVRIEFNYQDHTATYGLTHVTVPNATEAVAHVRTDDNVTLFINDERVGAYKNRGSNSSSRIHWRGPHRNAADGMRLPVSLRAGRNKVLLKVRNKVGLAGFTLALSNVDGSPIAGMATDAGEPDPPASQRDPTWKRKVHHDFKSKSFSSKFDTTVGRFKVQKKTLVGQSTDRGVQWRKYTVRPDFPKDSPSNLIWIKEKGTSGVTDFQLNALLQVGGGRPPKLLVTFQGDGRKDGLSGWSLILVPKGRDGVDARLERYDRLVYQSGPVNIPDAEVDELSMTVLDDEVTVTLNGASLLERVPIRPIEGRHRIGLGTWGPGVGLRELELRTPK